MARDIAQLGDMKTILYFCNGGSCRKLGSEELTCAMRDSIQREGLSDCVHTVKTLCAGFCEMAPVITVQPQNLWYGNVGREEGERIVKEHLAKSRPVIELIRFPRSEGGNPKSAKGFK